MPDEVEEKVRETIDPNKTRVRRRRQTGKGTVMLDLFTSEHMEEIAGNEGLREVGIHPRKPKLRNPRMSVRNVPSGYSAERLLDEILRVGENEQGLFWHMDKELLKHGMNFKFKKGPKNERTTIRVMEVTPKIRDAVRRNGSKIALLWAECLVTDFIELTRCYYCYSLGHIAGKCEYMEKRPKICAHCVEEGHGMRVCKFKNDPKKARCGHCKRLGRLDINHKCDRNCPVYRQEIVAEVKKTNYDPKADDNPTDRVGLPQPTKGQGWYRGRCDS